MAISDNLTSFWELEEASGTRNDSHGTNHLTDNNTVLSATGKVGTAADFEKANSESLTIASNATLRPGNTSFSICCWVKLESNPQLGIISKSDGSNGEYAIYYIGSSYFKFLIWGSAGYGGEHGAEDSFVFPTLGSWFFIVARHDAAADTISICVNDNTKTTTAHTTGAYVSTTPFNVGYYIYGGGNFDGLIDQVGYWARALTDAEVTFLYNSGAGRTYAEIAGSPPAVSDYRIIPPTLNFIQPAGQLAIVPATA